MSDCGCNKTEPVVVPTPALCAPVCYDEPVTTPAPCCLGCVYEDLDSNWVKPSGEATGILPVCDATKFRQGQCVAVLGTNGLGGVYSIDSVGTDSIEVLIHDGDTFDIGGAGTIQGGRIYLLPVCPTTQQGLIDIVAPSIPPAFTLAIGPTSDSTHGFSLGIDGTGKLILVYSQINFEAQVATYLHTLGVSLFKPIANTTSLTLFNMPSPDALANTTGTIDVAADFGVTVPSAATHVRLLVDFAVMAGHNNGSASAGDCSQMIGYLQFAGTSQFTLTRLSESIFPTVQSTQGASLRDGASRSQVVLDLPMTGGEVDWAFTHTLYHAIGSTDGGNDADAYARILGFLITP